MKTSLIRPEGRLSRLQPRSGFNRIDTMKTSLPIMVASIVAMRPLAVKAVKIARYDQQVWNRP